MFSKFRKFRQAGIALVGQLKPSGWACTKAAPVEALDQTELLGCWQEQKLDQLLTHVAAQLCG